MRSYYAWSGDGYPSGTTLHDTNEYLCNTHGSGGYHAQLHAIIDCSSSPNHAVFDQVARLHGVSSLLIVRLCSVRRPCTLRRSGCGKSARRLTASRSELAPSTRRSRTFFSSSRSSSRSIPVRSAPLGAICYDSLNLRQILSLKLASA